MGALTVIPALAGDVVHRCVRHASWLRAEQGNARAGDETTCPALIYGTTSSTAISPGVDPASRRANDGRLPSPSAVQWLYSTAANWNCRPVAAVRPAIVNVDSASETRHSPPPVQLTQRPPTVVRARSPSFRHLPDQPCARAAPRSADRGHADAGRHRQTAAGVRDTETSDAGRDTAPRCRVRRAVKARSAHRHRAGDSGRSH